MKKIRFLLSLIFAIILSISFYNVIPFSANASNDLISDFYAFEQAVIEENLNIEKERLNFENKLNENNEKTDFISLKTDEQIPQSQNANLDDDLSRFKLKCLIVIGQLTNDYGARKVISGYKDYNFLYFNSEKETAFAYKKLKSENLTVLIDSEVTSEGYVDNSYDYSSYLSWGAEAMDIGGIRDYLTTNGTSEEVVVVVMDTGINTTHERLTNRILQSSDGKYVGDSYYTTTKESDYAFEDDAGHGTHVSGIITGLTPTNVKIMPIKVLGSDGSGSYTYIVTAFEKILEVYSTQYNIACVNMSLGGITNSATVNYLNTILVQLNNANITTVVAAGNEQIDTSIVAPAGCTNAITVSALKQDGTSYSFDFSYSNFGDAVDVCAPGSLIISSYINSSTSYARASGTSMATPHVAGAVALLYCDNSYWTNNKCTLTTAEITNLICSNTIDLGSSGWDKFYGYGMINLKYFNTQLNENALTFKDDNENIIDYTNFIEVDSNYHLSILSQSTDYKIYYTTDGTIPSNNNGNIYSSPIAITSSTKINVIGYKIENGNITENTPLYQLDFFNPNDNLESFFTLSGSQIIGYTGHFETLTIPRTINGTTVTSIGKRVFNNNNIVNLTLPSTITMLDNYCFSNCKSLQSINFDNVSTIKAFVFENCESLTNIDLTCVTALGEKIEKVDVNGNVFNNCTSLSTIYLPNIIKMGSSIFTNSSVDKVYIGKSLTTCYQQSINKGITIYGYTGTTAESHASSYSLNFVALDELAFETNLNTEEAVHQTESLTLSVSVLGAIPKYQWYNTTPDMVDNGTIISGQTSSSLQVDTSIIGTFKYFVKITDWEGSEITSNICTVSVLEPPYTITYMMNDGTTNSDQQTYYAGDTIEFIANPTREGFDFVGWYLDSEGNNAFTLTTMPEYNITVYAKWKVSTFTITASAGNNGSISPNGEISVNYGDNQTFQFTANSGYVVKDIKIDNVSLKTTDLQNAISNGYTFENVKDNHAIDVEFEKITYYIIYMMNDGTTTSSQQSYKWGDTIVLINNATREGFDFIGWYLDSEGNDAFTLTTMPEYNITVYAKWEVSTFTITASAGDNGSISPNGEISVNYGDNQTFQFVARNGFYIKDIKIDNVSLNSSDLQNAISNGYTFENVKQNHTIYVQFKEITYKLTYILDSITNGALNNITQYYDYNEVINPVSAPTWKGHRFVNWVDENGNTLEFSTMPANDLVVYGKYEILKYTITTSIKGNGNISPTDKMTLEYGQSQIYDITADEGYHITSILVDNIEKLNSSNIINRASWSFDNVTSDHSLKVIFEINTYMVKINAGDGGSAATDLIGNKVKHGENVKITIKTDFNMKVDKVYINNELTLVENNEFVISNVEGDLNVKITFTYVSFWLTTSGKTFIGIFATIGGIAGILGLTLVVHVIRRKIKIGKYDRD